MKPHIKRRYGFWIVPFKPEMSLDLFIAAIAFVRELNGQAWNAVCDNVDFHK